MLDCPNGSVRYRIGGVDGEVHAPSMLLDALDRTHRLVERGDHSSSPGCLLDVRNLDDGWTIGVSGGSTERCVAGPNAFGKVALAVGRTLVSSFSACSSLTILPATAVERGGEVLAIVGPPRGGKSTLAAHLLARGWRLVSDHFAVIEPETRNVLPYHALMSLDSDSYNYLPRVLRPSLEASPWYSDGDAAKLAFYAVDPEVAFGSHVWSQGGCLRAVVRTELAETFRFEPVPSSEIGLMHGVAAARLNPGPPVQTVDRIETWFDQTR